MKRFFLLLIPILAIYLVSAQKFMLNGYSSYVFEDGIGSYYSESDYYNGKIKASYQWGAGVEFLLHPHVSVEAMYLNQNTSVPVHYRFEINQPEQFVDFDLDLHFLLIGVQSVLSDMARRFEGHGGILGGMVVMDLTDPRDGNQASLTKFSWGGRVGGNYWVTRHLGIKLQAQLLAIRHSAGGTYYFNPSGAGFAKEAFSTIFQCGLGGGIVFRFGKAKKADPKTFYQLNL